MSEQIITIRVESDNDPTVVAYQKAFGAEDASFFLPFVLHEDEFSKNFFENLGLKQFCDCFLGKRAVSWTLGNINLHEFFSIEELVRIIAFTRLRDTDIRIFRGPHMEMTGAEKEKIIGNLYHISEHFFLKRGSVVLNFLEKYSPALRNLAFNFQRFFGSKVWINSYFTPPASQTLLPHWDDHDVILLQIEGKKKWILREPKEVWPVNVEVPVKGDLPNQYLETELSPGMALYIPAGHIHSGVSSDEHSLHLTVSFGGLPIFSVLEVLFNRVLNRYKSRADFRAPIYLGDGHLPETIGVRLKGMADEIFGSFDFSSISEVIESMNCQTSEKLRSFETWTGFAGLDSDLNATQFKYNGSPYVVNYNSPGESMSVTSKSYRMYLPKKWEPVFLRAASAEPFGKNDLNEILSMTDDRFKDFVYNMILLGLISSVENGGKNEN